MKTFAMNILGCKVNDYEATVLKTKLLNNGYKEVSFKDIADIYIIFTCCVTNTAESKTRKAIHHARNLNKDAYVVAVGCLVQIKGDSKDFEVADLIVGSKDKDKLFDLIDENVKSKDVSPLNNKIDELYLESYPGKSRAFLKVQDGCNQFCSYCIIPYARGREVSANHLKVIEQAKILAKTCKELVLVGIHTGRYNDGEFNLYDLLVELEKIEDLKTIRLSSIEITEVSDEIINLVKNSKKIAHHFHIPVQSANNEILSLMHRPYTIEEYIDRINYIRNEIEDVSISTDLIVGFPSETEECFNDTLNNLKKINFSFIHVFPYARKSKTVADRLEGHINEKIKKERLKKVMEIEKPITKSFINKFIDKEVEVLIEKKDENYLYGYAKQYFYVTFVGNGEVGEVVKVKIDKIEEDKVLGHVS